MEKDRPRRLSTTFIKNIKQPGRYSDGPGANGLSLMVKETKDGRLSKTFSQRIRIAGKPTNLGLGSWPVVSLEMARGQAFDHARMVAEGKDPRTPPVKIPTVDEVGAQMRAERFPEGGNSDAEKEWLRIHSYCEAIGSKPVSEVTSGDVIRVIGPIWLEKNPTALDVRAHLSRIMRRAIRDGHRASDPAESDITRDLGRPEPPQHHRSLDHGDVGEALSVIRDADIWWSVKYGLIFLALTCVRSGDVRGATWEQMDLESENPTWHIPRTKNGRAHDVPLATQAVEILLHIEARTGSCEGLIFPSRRGGKALNKATLSKTMRRLGIAAVPHGFRASCRNWAGGRADIAQPAAEMVLAHQQSNAVVAAYLTDDFFEERVSIMQEWADYVCQTMGPVISAEDQGSEMDTDATDPDGPAADARPQLFEDVHQQLSFDGLTA